MPLYDASHIYLDVFTPLESVDLLQRFIDPRPESGRQALQEIAALCGHLPLAIAIVGGYLRRRPNISVATFAAELADTSRHLDKLDIGRVNVRAVFDLSYSQLDQAVAKAFRLLSWFPGSTIDTAAAAALLDTSIQLAERRLDELFDRHLIELQSHRYRYHDLLRAYAQEASKAVFPDERTAALVRLRDWYLDRARHAVTALTTATVDGPGAVTRNEALAWLEDERMNVLSLAAETVTSHQASYVWELSDTLYPFYDLRGHWTDCQAIHELALQVARSAQNQTAAERILNNLGVAYREQHQYTACISCLEESITLSRSSGSRETTTLALMNLGVAHHGIGQLLEAATCLESALSLSRELGLNAATRQILGNLGNAYYDMSRHHDALNAYLEALDLCRSANDRRGEGVVLVNLGTLYREQGLLDEALACLRQSLEIARDMFDRVSEGRALRNLGSVSAARGASDEAIAELEASTRIADQARDVETVYLACLGLGDIYLSRDNTREARNWYEACRRAGQEIGDLKREAKVITALAAVADRDNEAELALTYRRHAVTLLRDSSDRRSLASALSGTGSALMNLGRASEALVCFEEAAAIARDLSDPPLELEALRFLADVLQELGQDSDVSAARRRIYEIGGLLPM